MHAVYLTGVSSSDFCTSFISSSDVLCLMKAREDGSDPCSTQTGSSRPQTHQQRLWARVNEPVGPGATYISLQQRSREMHDKRQAWDPPDELLIRADERQSCVITTSFCSSTNTPDRSVQKNQRGEESWSKTGASSTENMNSSLRDIKLK